MLLITKLLLIGRKKESKAIFSDMPHIVAFPLTHRVRNRLKVKTCFNFSKICVNLFVCLAVRIIRMHN